MKKKHTTTFDSSNIDYNTKALHMQRSFEGIWCPAGLWVLKNLTWAEKLLILEINSLDTGNGCYASNEYLAGFIDVSESRLKHILTELRKKGWIETVHFDGRKRYLRINDSVQYALSGKIGRGAECSTSDVSNVARRGAECSTSKMQKSFVNNEKQTTYKGKNSQRYIEEKNKITKTRSGQKAPTRERVPNNLLLHDKTSKKLFDTSTPQSLTKSQRIAVIWTNRLWNAVAKKRLLDKSSRKIKWNTEFQEMIENDDFKISEIKEILNWYITKIGKPYVSDARCAKSFRDKFTDIKSQYMREKAKLNPETENEPQESTVIARNVGYREMD